MPKKGLKLIYCATQGLSNQVEFCQGLMTIRNFNVHDFGLRENPAEL
jgi:hypothetical protein